MIFKILLHIIWIALLTLLTQIGGLIWLVALAIGKMSRQKWPFHGVTWLVFTLFYFLATLFIVPPLARISGRIPLPVSENPHLRPENIWFCLLNRHYVRPGLRRALEEVATQMQTRFPGTVIWYMDANFPFFDGYPLEPHFSHRDGKKVDLSIYWNDARTAKSVKGNPSPFGYGVFAGPLPGERDYAAECERKGYWYIGLDGDLAAPFYKAENYVFDADQTAELLRLLAGHPAVARVLIQPHLKTRLGLSGFDKLRFQGCKAARHDDHAHVELR